MSRGDTLQIPWFERVAVRCRLAAPTFVASDLVASSAAALLFAQPICSCAVIYEPRRSRSEARVTRVRHADARWTIWKGIRGFALLLQESVDSRYSSLPAGRAISCLPLVTVSSFSCRASAITGGGAELSRSALVSLRSAFAESFVHTFSPSFRKQVAAHHEGGAAEAPRHRDRKVAIVLVGRECISEVHRSMNITHPPQRL